MARLNDTVIYGDLKITGDAIFKGNKQLSSDGYTVNPDGTIIQWRALTSQPSSGNGGWPLEFPNACLALFISYNTSPASNTVPYVTRRSGYEKSAFTWGNSNVGDFTVIGIGY